MNTCGRGSPGSSRARRRPGETFWGARASNFMRRRFGWSHSGLRRFEQSFLPYGSGTAAKQYGSGAASRLPPSPLTSDLSHALAPPSGAG